MTLIKTLELNHDLIEIHYNPNLSNKPYLVRIFSYIRMSPEEKRLDKDELEDLYGIVKEHNLWDFDSRVS